MGWIKLVQCLRSTGMPMEDLHTYAELMQLGDETAGERLRLLGPPAPMDDMNELSIALDLVEHQDRGLRGGPGARAPRSSRRIIGPHLRRVRVRAPGEPGGGAQEPPARPRTAFAAIDATR